MNRRKIIQSISSACSAAGVPHAGEFAVYGSERKPTLAVIHLAVALKPEQVESIRECWNHLRKASPGLPPCVVLDRGLTLEMHETDQLVERARMGGEMSGWTPTWEKLPRIGRRVLVQSFSSCGVVMNVARRKRTFYDRGKMQRNRWEDNTGRDLCYYVEFWRPLPAAASYQRAQEER